MITRITMKNVGFTGCFLAALGALLAGCGGDDLKCGAGTVKSGSACVAAAPGSGGSAGDPGSGGSAGEGGTGGSTGGSSSGGSAGTGNVDEPPTFEGVKAVAPASDTSLLVAWQPATDDQTPEEELSYNVYLATAAGMQNFGVPTRTTQAGLTSVILTNLPPDTEHWVVVRAVDGAGNEDANSTELSGTAVIDTTSPTFAGATGAESAGATSVRVSWAPGSDDLSSEGAISYMVFWSDSAGLATTGTLGIISPPGATSVVVPNLPAPETEYFFNVKAIDAAGNAADNDVEVAGSTGVDDTPPVFGGCVNIADPSASSATLTWSPARDDVTRPEDMVYRIYALAGEIEDGDPLGAPFGEVTGVTTGQAIGLDPGTDYSFVCRAVDTSDNEDANYVVRLGTTKTDGAPPVFAGITDVTVGSTTAELRWDPATDDQTPQNKIRYLVYQATTTGGHDFTKPFASSNPGEIGIMLTGLESNTEHFWVVRARDEALNESDNTAETNGTTLVSFLQDVEPIFFQKCAKSGCHVSPAPPQGLLLEPGFAYSNIVNAPAVETANPAIYPTQLLRVDPTPPIDLMNSYLWHKITGIALVGSAIMPPETAADPLSMEQIDTIGDWILQGALEN